MYNKLHDGPPHLPLGPRKPDRSKKKPPASLVALQWAADRVGQSYGMFTLNLTPEQETRIQIEYELYRQDCEAAVKACHAERVIGK